MHSGHALSCMHFQTSKNSNNNEELEERKERGRCMGENARITERQWKEAEKKNKRRKKKEVRR